MIKLYHFDELKPEEILNRDIRAEKNVEDVVDAIIADVRARGDDALKDYALKFDGAAIENLQVTQAEIDEAFAAQLFRALSSQEYTTEPLRAWTPISSRPCGRRRRTSSSSTASRYTRIL